MEEKFEKVLDDFCRAYNVDSSILRKYLWSIEIGDLLNADMYHSLLYEECPSRYLGEMEQDLKIITKQYFEKV